MVDFSKNTETDREITAFFWNYQIFSEKKRIFVWIIVLAVKCRLIIASQRLETRVLGYFVVRSKEWESLFLRVHTVQYHRG